VPISWKDLFDTAGVATEAGSRLLEGRVPAADAPVLGNATALGLVCLGKTHMTELAFSGLGYNPMTATPPCVNDVDAVPGGSSSGAAASVAFGLASAGIGSDTGGSVRVPSAWNDLVGLKTTGGGCRSTASRRSCRGSTRSGRSAGRSRMRRSCSRRSKAARPADLRGATLEGARFLILDTVAFDDIRPRRSTGSSAPWSGWRRARRSFGRGPGGGEAMALSAIDLRHRSLRHLEGRDRGEPEAMFPQVLERFRGGKAISGRITSRRCAALDRLGRTGARPRRPSTPC
jgi:aspartyl-tRNA(Asn)/glutamyl-tRNA(Gln) amidotransferase subunit A